MSLYTVTTSLFGIKPKVWVDPPRLCARTGWSVQLLTLFSRCRRVVVDAQRRVIEIDDRWLWVISKRRTIPFDQVYFLEYKFGSLGTGWGSIWTNFERTDQVERYTVVLVLKETEERVRLFNFVGEGSVETGWTGVLLGGDSLLDVSGDQGEASQRYVDMLQACLGVPIGRPVTGVPTARAGSVPGGRRSCVKCGRPSPPNKKRCQYCGGELSR